MQSVLCQLQGASLMTLRKFMENTGIKIALPKPLWEQVVSNYRPATVTQEH